MTSEYTLNVSMPDLVATYLIVLARMRGREPSQFLRECLAKLDPAAWMFDDLTESDLALALRSAKAGIEAERPRFFQLETDNGTHPPEKHDAWPAQ